MGQLANAVLPLPKLIQAVKVSSWLLRQLLRSSTNRVSLLQIFSDKGSRLDLLHQIFAGLLIPLGYVLKAHFYSFSFGLHDSEKDQNEVADLADYIPLFLEQLTRQ